MDAQCIISEYHQRFSETPIIIRSPGRINLMGEHTDYNQGLVLPAAIDKEIILAMGANDGSQCHLYSYDLQQCITFSLNELDKSREEWANYVIGVVRELQDHGHKIGGFNLVFGGDIPIGAGLSSSAALECGVGFGLNKLWGLDLDKLQIVRFALQAENNFVGVNCGIMDQFANTFGKPHQLIQLDCRSLKHQYVEVDFRGFQLLLLNSNVKHELASSEYNQRRMECETGVRQLQKFFPEVQSLRDCDLEMLQKIRNSENSTIFNRCKFVIEENQRVIAGSRDLQQSNFKEFGEKMYACHQGLSDLYQVSCLELDVLVALTRDLGEVLGARMMGGGFGGCTINLVEEKHVEDLIEHIARGYTSETGKEMTPYSVNIADGTSLKE